MKKFLCSIIVSAAAIPMIFASQTLTQEQIFDATIKEVDMGGIALQYQNLEDLNSVINSLFEMFSTAAAMQEDPMKKMQIEMGLNAIRQIVQQANFDSIQSYAASIKKVNDNTFINKSFILTDNNPQGGLYDFIGKSNQPFQYLNIVPENALLAVASQIDLGTIYNSIYNNNLKNNPMVGQYIPMLEMQLGMPMADFMKSISGEYVAFATTAIADSEVTLQGLVRIPDNSGALTKFLQMLLGTQESVVMLPPNQNNPMIAPVIAFAEKSVIVASNQLALNQSIQAQDSKKNITANPIFAESNKYLSGNGLSQLYFVLDEAQVQLINSAFISLGLEMNLKPIYLVSESTFTGNGYKTVAVSSFNLASPKDILAFQLALMKIGASVKKNYLNINPDDLDALEE